MLFGQKFCPDCEPAQVNHFVMRASSYLGLCIKPVLRPFDYLTRVILPPRTFSWFDIVAPKVLNALAWLRIGKLRADISEDDSDRTRALWEEAKRRGIKMVMFCLGPIKDLFIATHGKRTICFDGLPRPV